MNRRSGVLCIVGPTACGKTALSVQLAETLGGEIVSADAVAVYRGLDIGSAKPSAAERKGIPHHLIDCADVTDQSFTVSTFRTLAREAIDDILRRERIPIVVGGSGLYLDAIFSDMRFSAPSDPMIRSELEKEYDLDRTAVFNALKSADPAAAARLHVNDRKRVVRALEVFRVTGKPFSELNRAFSDAQQNDESYQTLRIGLKMDRSILYRRIDARVDEMIRNGLKTEAYSFFDRGLTPENCRALQSIGYAQLFEVYRGACTLNDAIVQIKLDTRHFAKRRITWFKRDRNTVWLDPTEGSVNELTWKITEIWNGNQ